MTVHIGRQAGVAWLALAASALVVASWMVWQPHTADLAAQVYRAGLFERVGWTLWDNNWFGGHHVPGYSLLTPWLMANVGIAVTGAVAALTTTGAFPPSCEGVARSAGGGRRCGWRGRPRAIC